MPFMTVMAGIAKKTDTEKWLNQFAAYWIICLKLVAYLTVLAVEMSNIGKYRWITEI